MSSDSILFLRRRNFYSYASALLLGIFLAGTAAAAALPKVTNVAGLRQATLTQPKFPCRLNIEAVVCSVNRSGRSLILADESGAELVMLESAWNVQPGQRVRLTSENCELLRRTWGVAIVQPPLVDNDGLHAPLEKSGKLLLAPGRVPIRLQWFNAGQGRDLRVRWRQPGGALQMMAGENLWRSDRSTQQPGLDYQAYEGSWLQLPDFLNSLAVTSGVATNFTVTVATRLDNVGLEFNGWLEVARAGEHEFVVRSDDGAQLFVGAPQPRVEILEPALLPVPLALRPGRPQNRAEDFCWAEVEGEVQSVMERSDCVEMELKSGLEFFRVGLLEREGLPLKLLLNSRVRLQGVGRIGFRPDGSSGLNRLQVVSLRDVRVEQVIPALALMPPTTLGEICREPATVSGRILRVQGRLRPGAGADGWEITDGTNTLPLVARLPFTPVEGPVEVFGTLGEADSVRGLECGYLRALDEAVEDAARRLPLLTSALQIQRLPRSQAALGYPARVRGVIICDAPEMYYGAVIQDQTRGIFFHWGHDRQPPENTRRPRLGEYWEIEGVTEAGLFAPDLVVSKLTCLGEGQLPQPLTPTWEQLMSGALDTQFVEMQGIITEVRTNAFTFLTHGGKIQVRGSETILGAVRDHINSLVRLRGCLLALWDGETHRMKPGEIQLANASLAPDFSAAVDPFNVPEKSVEDLLLYDLSAGPFQRVKMTGQILERSGDVSFMASGNKGLRLILREKVNLQPGERVEVAGIPEIAGPAPVLREAVVRRMGSAPLPAPLFLKSEQLANAAHDARRVRLEAIFNGERQAGAERYFDLQTGENFFSARLPPTAQSIPKIQPGSRVEVTGVYAALGRRAGSEISAAGFEILLYSPADVRVLARPPWWTLQKLFAATGGLLAVLVLAALWITQLRRRVEERTAQLRTEIEGRERAEQQRLVAEEKSRIARDLHDDLGSSLTEIGLQANVAQRSGLDAAQATEQFGVIADKTRVMVSALDVIVWAVDPEENTLQATADYLAGYAEEFLAACGVERRLKIPVELPPVTLDGHTRHGLFLALKEALNNVVRHAQAGVVEFAIAWEDRSLHLRIADNGRGFDPAIASPGHGVSNLHKRLAALGGKCEIISRPNSGTTITLSLPLKS